MLQVFFESLAAWIELAPTVINERRVTTIRLERMEQETLPQNGTVRRRLRLVPSEIRGVLLSIVVERLLRGLRRISHKIECNDHHCHSTTVQVLLRDTSPKSLLHSFQKR